MSQPMNQWRFHKRLCAHFIRVLTAAAILLATTAGALAFDNGSSRDANPITTESPVVSGLLEEVIAVTPGHFPPQYDVGENGEATGFAIEVADRVAALAGLRFKYLILDNWGEAQDALRTGLADVSPNNGITEARKNQYDFTAPVETFHISILVRNETFSINGIADLSGRKVAVEKTHVGVRLLEERGDVELVLTASPEETLFALLSGQADALVYTEPVIMKVAKDAHVHERIKVVGKPLLEIKRGMAVRKGNTVLLQRLDQAVKAFVGSPEYQAIYAKWYGEPHARWTTERIATAAGVALALVTIALGFWRYHTVAQLSRNLKNSIAKRKQAEKLNTRLGRIFEDSVNEIFVFDAETLKFIQVNRGARENLGYTMEELRELTAVDIKPEVSAEQFAEMTRPLRDGTQELAVFTTVHERKDGSCYDVQVRLQLARNESPQIFFAIIEDITERKQAEKLNTRLGRIFEDSVNEIFVFDAETLKFIQVNRGARENLGYTMEELRELTAVDIKPEVSAEQFAEMTRPLRDGTQELAVFTTVHERKDGSCYDVQVRLQLARNESPQIFFAIIEDITERKQAEDQIRQLNEDLEKRVEERTSELKTAQEDLVRSERLATLGHLTATVSHELRNPLGVVRASAFVLHGRLKDEDPRTQRALERIERSVVRCDRIIDELLDFTKISEIEFEPTDLDVWLGRFLEEQTLPAQVTLQREFNLSKIVTSFDRDRFGRVITNIIDNACQAMLEGGKEESSVEHRLTITTRESNGRIEVVLEDNGPGVPEENMPRIFEPLFSTRNFGVGLGLAVVKQIMEQHGGGIDIQSEPGHGARVILWFAVDKQTEGVAA